MISRTQQILPSQIYAEAVVCPASGGSLLSFNNPITSENVEQFHVDSQRIKAAADQLVSKGFEILELGPFSITIRGSPALYEEAFQTTLVTEERPVIKAFGCLTTGTFINAADAQRPGFIDLSASRMAALFDGVVINEPAYYFGTHAPAACPPHPAYWHLNVPDDIAQGLHADQVHREGLTGDGVKVVMVDTGWYPDHRYFQNQNYHAEVILGPGVANDGDTDGHGTGESANLLAVAPGIAFTMVKADVQIRGRSGNVNSIAALKKAIALQPDIISCSWGTNCPQKPLSPYEQILEATIAEAIRKEIIVVFAAGNGHCGFPAQHPEVIAAGGVYMNSDGSLEASDYTSGFVSPIYQRRFVPDVCGLVGKPPKAAYIMLPVPPGSLTDRQLWQQGASYPDGDETEPDDGWAAFSGTSAAAPQIAGVCALMKQANRDLSPPQAKHILEQTARDINRGCCSQYTGSNRAGEGFDLATGYGLVDALQAVRKIQAEREAPTQCQQQPEPNLFHASHIVSTERVMDSTLKIVLQPKFEEIQWILDKALRNFMKDNPQMPKVELVHAEFSSRSSVTEAAAVLRTQLETSKDLMASVSAAEGLLKIKRYQRRAIAFLSYMLVESVSGNLPDDFTNSMQSCIIEFQKCPEDDRKSELRSRILKAMGEISCEVGAGDDLFYTTTSLGSGTAQTTKIPG